MQISVIDWIVIGSFFLISTLIGIMASRRAGKSFSEYFLAGGRMPWWMLGLSMVATTFAADTPNLVTDIVRKNGISGNWVWWSFLLT
ncbi:MAG: Na+:solute symporter, partial [Planctomycetota bacterium]